MGKAAQGTGPIGVMRSVEENTAVRQPTRR